MQFGGRYFDGETGARLTVEVRADPEAGWLHLIHPDLPGGGQRWRFADLRRLRDEARKDRMTVTLRADHAPYGALTGAVRLAIDEPRAIRMLRDNCPDLDRRDLRQGTFWKITSRVGLAAGAIALMIFVILPAMAGTMARLIPVEREVRWGKTVVAQMERFFGGSTVGALRCSGEGGAEALDAMVRRLTAATDMTYELNVQVFDHAMVNAFAAPGGQIVIMRGLIDKAETPEEVAGVLAHEIGHVENRDATRLSLRAAGSAGLLAMVLGDFAGGSIAVVMAEVTLNASYSREAETEADAFARRMLDRAGVDVGGMARFFDRLGEEEPRMDVPGFLASHPDLGGRSRAARDFAASQEGTKPLLTDGQWQALRNICG